jgi:hypothetical protein
MYKLFPAILILSLIACKEISFKEPQPKGKKSLSKIPRELLGSYLVVEEKGTDSKELLGSDVTKSENTLVVTTKGYYVPGDSSKEELGDSLVLKKYKGYYFFNDNENPEWLLRVVKREPNGDLSYMLLEPTDKSFNEFLLAINKEIEIDSVEVNNQKLYQIDPSPKKLISLIEKGYFKKTITLKKLK